MSIITVVDTNKEKVKELNVPDEIFSYKFNKHLIWEEVKSYLASQRQGTHCTKTRGEVSGSGRKLWRQKKTGRARVGSIRTPLWRKGGTVFGPKPRDYSYELPKKAKRNALKSALSYKLKENLLIVVDNLEIPSYKTKEGALLMRKLGVDNALFVDSHENRNLALSVRNIPSAGFTPAMSLNTYDLLKYKWIVVSERALDALMERLT
ncbi:MAG: 50S ribosomal protein L4 [Thermodesulfovibrionales bacterium]